MADERIKRYFESAHGLGFVRVVTVLAQAITIVLTWRVWEVREFPPLLPLWDLPQVSMARPLIVSLALVVVRPRLGVAIHFALLIASMILDQTRIQPYSVSCAILMLGTLSATWGPAIARTHLISLWFYAGLHKVIGTVTNGTVDSTFLPESIPVLLGERMTHALTLLAMCLEIAIGVMAIPRCTRRYSAAMAIGLHTAILAALVVQGSNIAVWPWQVALVVAASVYIWKWRESFRGMFSNLNAPLRAALVLVLVSPAGFYFGVVDPYLAHCLYAQNTPRAWIVSRFGAKKAIYENDANVILQPVPRLFQEYFESVAKPGDVLMIKDGDRTIIVRHSDLH